MDRLTKIEEMIDSGSGFLKDAQELLSLTDPREAAIGGALSVIEVSLGTVSEVLEKLILDAVAAPQPVCPGCHHDCHTREGRSSCCDLLVTYAPRN